MVNLKKLNKESFKNKIVRNLIFSLGFTVIAVIVTALSIHVIVFYQTVKKYNSNSSETISNFIDEKIKKTVTDLSYLGRLLALKADNDKVLLKSFIEQYAHYSSVWETDSTGIIKRIYPGCKYLLGTDRSGSEVYLQIIEEKKQFLLSSVFLSPETNLSSFDVAIPFGKGLLATTITSTVFTDDIMKLDENNDHFITLTDRKAGWLAHPDKGNIIKRVKDADFKKYSALKVNEAKSIISRRKGKLYLRYIRKIKGAGWVLSIFHPLSEIYLPVLILFIIVILISFPIIVFSFSFSYRVIKKFFTPLENFIDAAEKIGEGDYHYEIPCIGYEEFDRVRTALAKMVENIDLREEEQKQLWLQLLQSQKMESIGNLASGVAHDFNDLLTAIGGYSDIISINFKKGSRELAYIDEVNKAVERASALTRQLLAFSRKEAFKTESIDLNNLIEGIFKMLKRIVGEEISITLDLNKDIKNIEADPHQFEQILLNLTVNGRDALIDGGVKDPQIVIVTERDNRNSEAAEEFVIIKVFDNGPGIPKGIREHIFESFYTTKEKGKGTGLGLSTVMGIIKQNGAEIEVGKSNLDGAEFKISWPVSLKDEDKSLALNSSDSSKIGMKKVLYVDDESILREIGKEVLRELNHEVEVASNGEDALRIIEEEKGKFDLIITDIIMPKMGGAELTKKVKLQWPQIKFIYVTGYVDEKVEKDGIDLESNEFLRKPFNMNDLRDIINNIFSS